MLGGHQAKAMPAEILADPRMRRCAALVIGEAETRVAELLGDHGTAPRLPGVLWLPGDAPGRLPQASERAAHTWLAPDINALPFVDRALPRPGPAPGERPAPGEHGRRTRLPYDCSFCGAAVSRQPRHHHPRPRPQATSSPKCTSSARTE